jgi:hypothetical protein
MLLDKAGTGIRCLLNLRECEETVTDLRSDNPVLVQAGITIIRTLKCG